MSFQARACCVLLGGVFILSALAKACRPQLSLALLAKGFKGKQVRDGEDEGGLRGEDDPDAPRPGDSRLELRSDTQTAPEPWFLPYALMLLVILEFELGWRLLMGWSDLLTLGCTLALLLSFMSFLGLLIARGETSSCNCYGPWIKLSPREALKLDGFYLLAVAIVWMGMESSIVWESHRLWGLSALLVLLTWCRLKK